MKTSFIIQGRLSGLNEIVGEARRNRFAGAKQKKDETTLCAYAVMAGKVPVFKGPVKVRFDWFEPNEKRDPDNVRAGAKFVLDALVELGRIPGDGRKWIMELSDAFYVDRVNPRVEVFIEEAA